MKRNIPGIALLIFLAATVHSQQPPQLLLRASQCLEAERFLPSSNAAKLTFGYVLDEKSYPGEKVIYIVNYATPQRLNGLVFAVFLTERDGRQKFNIQNNASFVLSKSGVGRRVFSGSPAWRRVDAGPPGMGNQKDREPA